MCNTGCEFIAHLLNFDILYQKNIGFARKNSNPKWYKKSNLSKNHEVGEMPTSAFVRVSLRA